MVTTDTAQTITGQKTIESSTSAPLTIKNSNGNTAEIHFDKNSGGFGDAYIRWNGNGRQMIIGSNYNQTTVNISGFTLKSGVTSPYSENDRSRFVPQYNNGCDLGGTYAGSPYYWRNLYLSGNLSDGTNNIAIANIAAKTDIPAAVSGTNDGTNWTTLTIGSDTYGIGGGGGGSTAWGSITGTLSNQTDLANALAAKADSANLATVATTGDYGDLLNKPTIPAAVSGTNDGTNWLTITIGSDTYNIPAGGGVVDGFDFITLNTSSTSGTLTSAELARIADHPQRCVLVKYGSNAQYVQSYPLREVAYTNTSQTTVASYTFGYIQTSGTTQLKDRQVVVTASSGAWNYTQVQMTVPSVSAKYLQHVFSAGTATVDGVTYNFDFSSNYITTTAGHNPLDGGTNSNNFIRHLQTNHSAGNSGSTAISYAAAANGKLTFNNNTYDIVGISGYRSSSSNATLYIVYYDSTSVTPFIAIPVSYTNIASGYYKADTII